MTDKKKNPDDDVKLYTRVPEEIVKKLDHEVAERRMKRPQAIAEAIEMWLSNDQKSVALDKKSTYYSERGRKAIRKSSEAIRLIEESIAELLSSEEVKNEDVNDQRTTDTLGKVVDDAAKKTEHLAREAALTKEALQGSEERHRKRK